MFVHILNTSIISDGYRNMITVEFQFSRLEEPKMVACRKGWFDAIMIGKQVKMVNEYSRIKFYDVHTNTLYAELG